MQSGDTVGANGADRFAGRALQSNLKISVEAIQGAQRRPAANGRLQSERMLALLQGQSVKNSFTLGVEDLANWSLRSNSPFAQQNDLGGGAEGVGGVMRDQHGLGIVLLTPIEQPCQEFVAGRAIEGGG